MHKNIYNVQVGETLKFKNKYGYEFTKLVTRITEASCFSKFSETAENDHRESWGTVNSQIETILVSRTTI